MSTITKNTKASRSTQTPALRMLPTRSLVPAPFNPRKEFPDEPLRELAASIIEVGLIEPLVVRAAGDDSFQIVCGERRWRAAQLAEVLTVPCVVRELDDRQASVLALVENLQREQLNSLEESRSLASLVRDFGLSVDQVAERISRSTSYVEAAMHLLDLPERWQGWLAANEVTKSHGRAALPLLGSPAALEELTAQVARDLKAGELRSSKALAALGAWLLAREAGKVQPIEPRKRPRPIQPAVAKRVGGTVDRATFDARLARWRADWLRQLCRERIAANPLVAVRLWLLAAAGATGWDSGNCRRTSLVDALARRGVKIDAKGTPGDEPLCRALETLDGSELTSVAAAFVEQLVIGGDADNRAIDDHSIELVAGQLRIDLEAAWLSQVDGRQAFAGDLTGRLWDLLTADQLRSWAATWKVPRAAGSDHASLVASIEGTDRPLPLPREIARAQARMAIVGDCSAGGPFGQSAALAEEGSAKQCHI